MRLSFHNRPDAARTSGMTMVEVLIAFALGIVVLTVVLTLFVFGLRSFTGLGNYAILSGQSRLAVDRMSREIREATQILDCSTNLPVKWLTITNSIEGTTNRFTWDSTTGLLTWDKSGQNTITNLSGCDEWDISFFQRDPQTNWVFYGTTDLTLCKLISMSWKCSRTILGQKINTEDLLTSQVVLRNKP